MSMIKKYKCKCKVSMMQVAFIILMIEADMIEISEKKINELTEVLIYRQYALGKLHNRFSKMAFEEPEKKMSFNLGESLALKNSLMKAKSSPFVSKIFIQIDATLHPAIQLEI